MGTVDSRYAAPEGRKIVDASWNPLKLVESPNLFTIVPAVLLPLLVLGILLLVRRIKRWVRRLRHPAEEA